MGELHVGLLGGDCRAYCDCVIVKVEKGQNLT